MVPARDAGRFGQRGGAFLGIDEIDEREGEIRGVRLKSTRGKLGSILVRACVSCPRTKLAEQCHLALTDDALRLLGGRAEDPAEVAVVVGYRAVREGDVHLLGEPLSKQDQHQRFVVRAFAAVHRELHAWADHRPDLLPYGGRR